jgi:5'-nucleotidase
MVAPDTNRSACSHSIHFFSGPLRLKEIEEDTWSCSGTPVDCVIVSLLGGIQDISIKTKDGQINMEKAPDLILSGINAGANLGTDIIYSGTAAAARQGSFFGIPSVALSLVENESPWRWESVISYITAEISTFMGYWKVNTFVNINFPNIEKKTYSLVPVFPFMCFFNDYIVTFLAPNDSQYCFPDLGKTETIPADGSDWAEVMKGNAAICVVLSQPSAIYG